MAEPDTLRCHVMPRDATWCRLCPWKAASTAPLHLMLFTCRTCPNIIQLRLLQANQAESKEIPSLGSLGIIVLKVFEDGQTFMAFWDRMILKEPSYKTTRLHISNNYVKLGPFHLSSQFQTCYAKSCKDIFLVHPALLWGSCESNAHLIFFSFNMQLALTLEPEVKRVGIRPFSPFFEAFHRSGRAWQGSSDSKGQGGYHCGHWHHIQIEDMTGMSWRWCCDQ